MIYDTLGLQNNWGVGTIIVCSAIWLLWYPDVETNRADI